MNFTKLATGLFLVLALSTSALADNQPSANSSSNSNEEFMPFPGPGFPAPGPRFPSVPSIPSLYHARGTHQCWGKDAAGLTCEVQGSGYTDCAQARFSLEMMNCCKNTYYNGKRQEDSRSISFYINSCSSWG